MSNLHIKSNIKVKYIHAINNFYELAGPPLEPKASRPPSAKQEASIPLPIEPRALVLPLNNNVE